MDRHASLYCRLAPFGLIVTKCFFVISYASLSGVPPSLCFRAMPPNVRRFFCFAKKKQFRAIWPIPQVVVMKKAFSFTDFYPWPGVLLLDPAGGFARTRVIGLTTTISLEQPTKTATDTTTNQTVSPFTLSCFTHLVFLFFSYLNCIMVAFVNFLINERWWWWGPCFVLTMWSPNSDLGSTSRPLLFILYNTPLGSVISSLNLNHHLCADETWQLFCVSISLILILSVLVCKMHVNNLSLYG